MGRDDDAVGPGLSNAKERDKNEYAADRDIALDDFEFLCIEKVRSDKEKNGADQH